MDEFDHVLMEALNESVPTAMFTTNLAERLVARVHRRIRFWKMLFAFMAVSAAFGTIWTASELSGSDADADDERLETLDETPRLASNVPRR